MPDRFSNSNQIEPIAFHNLSVEGLNKEGVDPIVHSPLPTQKYIAHVCSKASTDKNPMVYIWRILKNTSG